MMPKDVYYGKTLRKSFARSTEIQDVYKRQPWRSDPELAKEIDEIGKRTGATYLGSGSARCV